MAGALLQKPDSAGSVQSPGKVGGRIVLPPAGGEEITGEHEGPDLLIQVLTAAWNPGS